MLRPIHTDMDVTKNQFIYEFMNFMLLFIYLFYFYKL